MIWKGNGVIVGVPWFGCIVPLVSFLVWNREMRQIKTQARYVRIIIIFLIYRHCLFPCDSHRCRVQASCRIYFYFCQSTSLANWKKRDLFNLELGILFELYTKSLSFSSTQGSEIDGFALEQIQGMKASAKPAPKTFLIAELWRAKRACGAPWVSKSTRPRKFGNHVTVHRPPARPSVRTTGKPAFNPHTF